MPNKTLTWGGDRNRAGPKKVEPALKKIPEPERGEWRAFWVQVQLVLQKRRPLR